MIIIIIQIQIFMSNQNTFLKLTNKLIQKMDYLQNMYKKCLKISIYLYTFLISPLKEGSCDKAFRVQGDFHLLSLLCLVFQQERIQRRGFPDPSLRPFESHFTSHWEYSDSILTDPHTRHFYDIQHENNTNEREINQTSLDLPVIKLQHIIIPLPLINNFIY